MVSWGPYITREERANARGRQVGVKASKEHVSTVTKKATQLQNVKARGRAEERKAAGMATAKEIGEHTALEWKPVPHNTQRGMITPLLGDMKHIQSLPQDLDRPTAWSQDPTG